MYICMQILNSSVMGLMENVSSNNNRSLQAHSLLTGAWKINLNSCQMEAWSEKRQRNPTCGQLWKLNRRETETQCRNNIACLLQE